MNLVASFQDCLKWEQGYKTFSRSQNLDIESTLMLGHCQHWVPCDLTPDSAHTRNIASVTKPFFPTFWVGPEDEARRHIAKMN